MIIMFQKIENFSAHIWIGHGVDERGDGLLDERREFARVGAVQNRAECHDRGFLKKRIVFSISIFSFFIKNWLKLKKKTEMVYIYIGFQNFVKPKIFLYENTENYRLFKISNFTARPLPCTSSPG